MDEILFRHQGIREYQRELIYDVYQAIKDKRHILAHAPTGIGKTDAVLGAALSVALKEDLNVFFLTPKISQHKIAVNVLEGLAKKYDLDFRAADIIGRRYACTDSSLVELDYESFYHSCEKKRKTESCQFYANAKGYNKLQQARAEILLKQIVERYGTVKGCTQLIKLAGKEDACAYELMLKIASLSKVIIADYLQLMVPNIRDIFLLRTKKAIDKSIIIVDEAHNLPKRVREQLSSSLNSFLLARAEKEMRLMGIKPPDLSQEFNKWAEERIKDRTEILVSKAEFQEFLSAYNMEPDEMLHYFMEIGQHFVEKTNRKSACLKISRFLERWDREESGSIRILRKKGGFFSLSKRFLDPSIATGFLNDAYATVMMSGTLLPLEMYRDVIGLEEEKTVLKKYPNPFSAKNRINIIVEGATTRYKKRDYNNYNNIARMIDTIVAATPGGTAVFFPSYVVQNAIVPLLHSKNLHLQCEGMGPRDISQLIRNFATQGGVLCGVQGGSLAEGIDYANSEIKSAVIVGIALEEMSLEIEALIDYYNEKLGKGWEYGYLYPAVVKAMQAAGRGVRKESDRCAVVFLDERFAWKNYFKLLNNGERFIITKNPERYVANFWKGGGMQSPEASQEQSID